MGGSQSFVDLKGTEVWSSRVPLLPYNLSWDMGHFFSHWTQTEKKKKPALLRPPDERLWVLYTIPLVAYIAFFLTIDLEKFQLP